jgi:hypothetical protein
MTEADVWRIERALWLEGAAVYEQRLAPEAIMVMPGAAGVLTRAATIEAIQQSPRWTDVAFESMRLLRPAANVLLLIYEATAERDGGKSAYRARCSSMYLDPGDGQWKLALHQQTPL